MLEKTKEEGKEKTSLAPEQDKNKKNVPVQQCSSFSPYRKADSALIHQRNVSQFSTHPNEGGEVPHLPDGLASVPNHDGRRVACVRRLKRREIDSGGRRGGQMSCP